MATAIRAVPAARAAAISRPIALSPMEAMVPAPSALLARVAGIAPALAAHLVAHYGSLGALRRVDAATLCAVHGLTRRQTARLRDALDLATSLLVEPRVERTQITSPRDAARLVLPEMGLLEQEHMRLLLLDTQHRVIATTTLYVGTVSTCQVRIAEIFREAVRHNASALVLVHNHPSGSAEPSPDDVRVTQEIVQAGRLLDVDVLDHLVVSRDSFTSLREHGIGWDQPDASNVTLE